MSAYLSIAGMRKTYGGTVALDAVSLEVERGQFLALLGPSGCGKTTLLRLVAGLLEADRGTIHLDGEPIHHLPAHRRDIGLVFQSYALFPHMTVADNVGFGLRMRSVPAAEARDRVADALELVKLGGYGARRPSELSGGQQQRVALARAIVIRPRLLLLDEPLSNLDAVLRTSVRTELRELHQRANLTTIMVTHDQAEAMTLADRIAVMSAGEVLQHDAPEAIYERPARAFIAAFVGTPPAALIRVDRALDGSFSLGGQAWTPAPALAGVLGGANRRSVILGLRPQDLELAAPGAPHAMAGVIRSVEYLGAERLVHVDLAGQTVTLRHTGRSAPIERETAVLVLGLPSIFDPETGQRLAA